MACSTRARRLRVVLPCAITNDPPAVKARSDEMALTAVATVCQDATVIATERFDVRSAVVDWIVAIAAPTAGDGDDA